MKAGDGNSPLRFAEDFDRDIDSPDRENFGDSARPFHDDDAALFEEFAEADFFEICGAGDAIGVEVKDGEAAAAVDVQEYEGGAADGAGVCAEGGGEAADEPGFACAEGSVECDAIAGGESFGDIASNGFGLRGAV